MATVGKKLVKDVRDGTLLFGEVNVPSAEEEAGFGIDSTDVIQVGNGTLKQLLPLSAARIMVNVTAKEEAAAYGDMHGGVPVLDCDANLGDGVSSPFIR